MHTETDYEEYWIPEAGVQIQVLQLNNFGLESPLCCLKNLCKYFWRSQLEKQLKLLQNSWVSVS